MMQLISDYWRAYLYTDGFHMTGLPALSNEVIIMLHSTSVAFAATVPDLIKVARDANADTFQSFYAFGLAGLLYLLVTFALVGLFRQSEQRWLAHLKPAFHPPCKHI